MICKSQRQIKDAKRNHNNNSEWEAAVIDYRPPPPSASALSNDRPSLGTYVNVEKVDETAK